MVEHIFSTNGMIIVVCFALPVALLLLFVLSFRYPTINIGAGTYKLSLGRNAEVADTAAILETPSAAALPPGTTEAGKQSSEQTEAQGTHWFVELEDAVKKQNRSKIEEVFSKFKAKPPFEETHSELEVWKYSTLLRAGFDDALQSLERLEAESDTEVDASRALARYYLNIKSPAHARPHIEKMITRSRADADLELALSLKSECVEESDGAAAAIEFLKREVGKQYADGVKSALLTSLGKLYSASDNSTYALAAYEKALSYNVRNKDARFLVAYAYGKLSALKKLAVRHYRILLTQDRGQSLAQNNLGVEYEGWGLQTKKISAWKAAREGGEGYALGNLALAYLEVGYVEEAQKLLDDEDRSWIKSADRVVYAQERIHKVSKKEQATLDEIVESAEALWDRLHRLPVSFLEVPFDGIGAWIESASSSSLTISQSGQILKLELKSGRNAWVGYVSTISGYTIVDVKNEKEGNALSLLSVVSSGQLILVPQEATLSVVHIESQSFVSKWEFVRALAD